MKRYTYWCRTSHRHEPMEQENGELVLYSEAQAEVAAAQQEIARQTRIADKRLIIMNELGDGNVALQTENATLRRKLELCERDGERYEARKRSEYAQLRNNNPAYITPFDGFAQSYDAHSDWQEKNLATLADSQRDSKAIPPQASQSSGTGTGTADK